MKGLNNPFLVYGYDSPMYFCDREKETQDLLEALENEYIYTAEQGYIIYDRFLAFWLRTI